MNLELTAKGAAPRRSARNAKHGWPAHPVAQLTDEERDTLFEEGEIIKHLVDKDPR